MLKRVNTYFEKQEFNRYGIMAMTLTAGSCLGSVAVLYIAQNNAPMWHLVACVGVSMLANVAAIGLTSMKLMLWTFVVSVIVNTLLILINL